jgi:hypothetical protein
MPTIIGIPLHIIVIGMPIAIIVVMRSHIAFIMSMVMPAVGIILQTMPSAVISQVIAQHGVGIIIGIIMPLFIIGIVMPFIMGIIMPFIIGMVIPFIIGICIGIVAVGICIAVIMVVPLLPCGGPSVRPFSSITMLRCRVALNRSWRRDAGFLRCRVGM